jgi:hypothetical protein
MGRFGRCRRGGAATAFCRYPAPLPLLPPQVTLKMAQEEARDSELGLRGDRRELQAVLKDMEAAHEDYLK